MVLAVVDASVVAKWFLEEVNTSEARRLRDDFLEGILQLRVPAILPFEVLNALRYHPRFRRRSLPEAGRAIDRAALVSVPLVGQYLEGTVNLAVDLDLTVYDASYVALARLLECPLYTADEGLVSAAEREDQIVHLRDYHS